RLVGSKLWLYQAKTGTPVYCPLPPIVIDALQEAKGSNPKYFFWSGNGKIKSAVADAQRSFRKLFERAEVTGHPHMFRDTFAVELSSVKVARARKPRRPSWEPDEGHAGRARRAEQAEDRAAGAARSPRSAHHPDLGVGLQRKRDHELMTCHRCRDSAWVCETH